MPERPAVPAEIKREVLIDAGHRCAVCGTTSPLELAHIIPWSKTKTHDAANLICLCANCHTLADGRNWGRKTLHEYKLKPWITRQLGGPADQPRATVEITIDIELNEFTAQNRQLLQYGLAGFLNIPPDDVSIGKAIPSASIVVDVTMPTAAASSLLKMFSDTSNAAETRAAISEHVPLEIVAVAPKGVVPVPQGHKSEHRVFIASPGDCMIERRAFKEIVDELNEGFAAGADAHIEPLAWEETLSTFGRSPQSIINEQVDACDCFIMVLRYRWGQEPKDSDCSSYTEEEFHRAMERMKKTGSPRIMVFLKKIDAERRRDPGPQLSKVLAFRKQLSESNGGLYKEFEDGDRFRLLVDQHLRALVKNELPTVDLSPREVVIPIEAVERINKAKEEVECQRKEAAAARGVAEAAQASKEALKRELEEERLVRRQNDIHLAQTAARAAADGRIEEARQGFAVVTKTTTDAAVLSLGCVFYHSIGELDTATELARRQLSVNGPSADSLETAVAYSNLGNVHRARGNLDDAECMYNKALAIHQKMGNLEGMAIEYSNLGMVHDVRGNLDDAEDMHNKSLEIEKKLGRLEGMAIDYGNLGNVHQARGNLDDAEDMYNKSLEIHQKMGNLGGMASQYGNLGNNHRMRGKLDDAEDMHNKSLEIEKKLGRLGGVASDYGNLGNVHQARGNLDDAEDMYNKALEIDQRIGNLGGIAIQYGNLGNVHQARGNLDDAEDMYNKALGIHQRMGHLEGTAAGYGNLGIIHRARGNLDDAENMYNKALGIQQEMGHTMGMAVQYCNLGNVHQTRGNLDDAEDMYNKALEIDQRTGNLAGMAGNYGNLGIIHEARGNLDDAEDMYNKALAIHQKMGDLEGMASDYGNLGNVHQTRGNIEAARESWTKSRDLFLQVGIPHKVEKVRKSLEELEGDTDRTNED